MPSPSIEESGTHDTTRVDDVRIAFVRPLLTPAVLLEDLPATPAIEALVQVTRAAIGSVLHGATTAWWSWSARVRSTTTTPPSPTRGA
jgi:hypothetical protein